MSDTPKRVWLSADETDKEFGALTLGYTVFFDRTFDGSEDLVEYVRKDESLEAELYEAIAWAVALYESYGLTASHSDAGRWINEARAVLAKYEGKTK